MLLPSVVHSCAIGDHVVWFIIDNLSFIISKWKNDFQAVRQMTIDPQVFFLLLISHLKIHQK